MQKTKIIIALAAVAALTLAAVGLAAAQAAQNQYFSNTQTPNDGVWGWIGNCFGYRAAQGYQGQYIEPPTGANATAPAPYQDGYGYAYGYGYGPCWAWR